MLFAQLSDATSFLLLICALMATVSNDLLRRDVHMLGELLGEVIIEHVGANALELVEDIRHLARRRRGGEAAAESQLARRVAGLSLAETRIIARSFSIFFDLANL